MLISNIFVHLLHLLSILGIPLAWVLARNPHISNHIFWPFQPLLGHEVRKGSGKPVTNKNSRAEALEALEALEAAWKVAWALARLGLS